MANDLDGLYKITGHVVGSKLFFDLWVTISLQVNFSMNATASCIRNAPNFLYPFRMASPAKRSQNALLKLSASPALKAFNFCRRFIDADDAFTTSMKEAIGVNVLL